MARGWESKGIEAQQEESARARRGEQPMPTAREREAASVRKTLELSRAKIEGDLRRATSPAHREMLQRALDDIDRRLRNPGSG